MKVNVKKADQNKRELSIEVTGEVVSQKFEDVYNQIGKDAKVAGFRPGKVPRDILEQHYGSLAHQEVLKSLIPQVYEEAIDAEKLDVVDLPQISQVKLDKGGLSFNATVEIKPEINIKDYKGIKINYKEIQVSAEEVKAKLDALKDSRKIENVDEAMARSLGYPTVAELENTLKAQIYIQKENEQRIKMEEQLFAHITNGVNFNLPASLVERQLKDMVSHAKVELALRGTSREELEKHEDKLSEQLKPEAQQRVRIYLILEAIARKENIALNEQIPAKVVEFLFREAHWNKSS